MIYRQFFLSSFLKVQKNPCIAPKNVLFLFNQLIINYFMQTIHNPQLINKGDGHYEWTGEKFEYSDCEKYRNILKDAKTLSFPNATQDICLDKLEKLQVIDAPKAIDINLIELDKLQVIDAPKAIDIFLLTCNKLKELNIPLATQLNFFDSDKSSLKSINAPKLQKVEMDEKHVDSIIRQLANPDKLEYFNFGLKDGDISKDIKNADREIKNRFEKEVVKPYLDEMMIEVNKEDNRKKQINKAFNDGDIGLVSAIGYYNFSDDENQRKALINTLKSNPEAKIQFNLECNAIQQDFKNYKKENLPQKTHENTAARENILNGVRR